MTLKTIGKRMIIRQNLEGIFGYIIDNWESKMGLLYTSIILILVYCCFITKLLNSFLPVEYRFIHILSVIGLELLLIIFWFLSTNRYLIRKGGYKYVGVSISSEELKEKVIVRKILNRVKNKINREFKSSNLCVRILPMNFINSQEELNSYFGKTGSQYDVIMILNTESGNYDNIEKLKIKKIWSIFLRIGDEVTRKIHFYNINYNVDLPIQRGSKDWNYTMSNDGNDKKKYLSNIYDLILFYTSLHLTYICNFKKAYEVLKPICDPSKAILESIKINGKREFRTSKIALSYARKNTMFIDLSFKEYLRHERNNDWESCYEVLKYLDEKFPSHSFAYWQKIFLARNSYELGNVQDAINYTKEAQEKKLNGVETYLNLGFFAILKNDPEELSSNYNKIYNKKAQINQNWADIIEFLLREQEKADNNLYNFAIGFLYKVFVNPEDSKVYFKDFFENDKHNSRGIKKLYDKTQRLNSVKNQHNKSKHISRKKRKPKRKRNKN